MKIFLKFLALGFFALGMAPCPTWAAAVPAPAAATDKPENMTGKFIVSSVTGKVEITSDDRIYGGQEGRRDPGSQRAR